MVRCGVDIVHIPPLAKRFHSDAFLRKTFHANELGSGTVEHLAGVLAAKEAFFKAVGIVPKMQDVHIEYEPSGRPKLIIAPEWQVFKQCDVSISHDGEYAIAMVLLEQ